MALGEIIASPWDRGLPEHVKRVALAERYDALIRLARGDGELAIRIVQGITPAALRERLHPALMDGLRASGMSSEELEQRFANKPLLSTSRKSDEDAFQADPKCLPAVRAPWPTISRAEAFCTRYRINSKNSMFL